MSKSNNKKKIVIEEDGKTFSYGGVKVSFNERGGVDVHGNVRVTVHLAANQSGRPSAGAAPQVGDVMPDGTIHAGVSPDTGRNMFVTPKDAPGKLNWKEAMKYAAGLKAHGHKDWRLPSRAELNIFFNNRAAIGGFNRSGSFPSGHYWSSEKYFKSYAAWSKRFSDGLPLSTGMHHNGLSVRCVRG